MKGFGEEPFTLAVGKSGLDISLALLCRILEPNFGAKNAQQASR